MARGTWGDSSARRVRTSRSQPLRRSRMRVASLAEVQPASLAHPCEGGDRGVDQALRVLRDVEDDSPLVVLEGLEGGELRIEEGRGHEVPGARLEATGEQLVRAVQVREEDGAG